MIRKADGWWTPEEPGIPECGPYRTKAEAEAELRGMRRTLRALRKGDRSYFTIEREKVKEEKESSKPTPEPEPEPEPARIEGKRLL